MRELLATIDSYELCEWIAFNNLDPITQDRGDAQAAMMCSTLANVWRGHWQRNYTVRDFMPDYGGQKKTEKPTQRQQFMQACASKGVKIKKG